MEAHNEELIEILISKRVRRFEAELIKNLDHLFREARSSHVQVYLHCLNPKLPTSHADAMAQADQYVAEMTERIFAERIRPAVEAERQRQRDVVDLRISTGKPPFPGMHSTTAI